MTFLRYKIKKGTERFKVIRSALRIIRLQAISCANMITQQKNLCSLFVPGQNLTADVGVAPIIAEQTAKLGRFTNYLQNWVSRGYWFCGQHRLNLSLTERFCVSPLVELVGQTNQPFPSRLKASVRAPTEINSTVVDCNKSEEKYDSELNCSTQQAYFHYDWTLAKQFKVWLWTSLHVFSTNRKRNSRSFVRSDTAPSGFVTLLYNTLHVWDKVHAGLLLLDVRDVNGEQRWSCRQRR